MSRYLAAFIPPAATARFSACPVPNKSEKAKTPAPPVPIIPEGAFSPYSTYSEPYPRENVPFCVAGLANATAEQAADEAADREAIAAEPLLPADRRMAEPLPEQVAALAEAMTTLMLASPVYAGTTPEAALAYCRAQAARRLALLPDPLARGLLVAASRTPK